MGLAAFNRRRRLALAEERQKMTTSITASPVNRDRRQILEEMTVAELRHYASSHGIRLGGAIRKDDIIAAILTHEGGDGDAGG